MSASEAGFTLAGLPPPGHYGASGDATVRVTEQTRTLVQVFARKRRVSMNEQGHPAPALCIANPVLLRPRPSQGDRVDYLQVARIEAER